MPIGNVLQRGKTLYVYDERGRILSTHNDYVSLRGYTSSTVNIQKTASTIYTYSETGQCLASFPVTDTQSNTNNSDDASTSEENLIKGFLSLLLLVIIVCAFHSPLGWLLSKTQGLTLMQGINASMSSLRGWLSVTLIWTCFGMLIFGVYTWCAKKLAKLFVASLVISVCSAVFLWRSLPTIAEKAQGETHQPLSTKVTEDSGEHTTRDGIPESTKGGDTSAKKTISLGKSIVPELNGINGVANWASQNSPQPSISEQQISQSSNQYAPPAKTPRLTDSQHSQPPGEPSYKKNNLTRYNELVSIDGRAIIAEILAITADSAVIRREDGEKFEIPFSRLSEPSVNNILEWHNLKQAQSSNASEIQKGASMQVKADSIWFQEVDHLTQWQKLKKGGDAKALSAYQKKLLSNRDSWQFTNSLLVRVLGHEAAKHQVHVEMTTPGRMLGTDWWLDSSALVQ